MGEVMWVEPPGWGQWRPKSLLSALYEGNKKARKKVFTRPDHADILILDFQPPEL